MKLTILVLSVLLARTPLLAACEGKEANEERTKCGHGSTLEEGEGTGQGQGANPSVDGQDQRIPPPAEMMSNLSQSIDDFDLDSATIDDIRNLISNAEDVLNRPLALEGKDEKTQLEEYELVRKVDQLKQRLKEKEKPSKFAQSEKEKIKPEMSSPNTDNFVLPVLDLNSLPPQFPSFADFFPNVTKPKPPVKCGETGMKCPAKSTPKK